jgi:hypothetical protein
MRPIFVAVLIFGMVAVSGTALADSVRIHDLSPGGGLVPVWLIGSSRPSLSPQDGTVTITKEFTCCGGKTDVTDLEATFSANLTVVGGIAPGCDFTGKGTVTATVTCPDGIKKGEKITLTVQGPAGMTFKSMFWSTTPAGTPEPQTLILFATGLLSLPLGARMRRRKLRM